MISNTYKIENSDRLQTQLKSNSFLPKILKGNEPSDEQLAIFDAILNDKQCRNIRVNAVAGSGKSTVIKCCVGLIPMDKKILVLAHNKNVKDHMIKGLEEIGRYARKKIPLYIQTFHGLGYMTIGKLHKWEGGTPDIGENIKYNKYFDAHITEFLPADYESWGKSKKNNYRRNIFDLLNYARVNLCQTEREIEKKAALKYGINPVANEISVVMQLMQWGKDNIGQMVLDFTDCIWLPCEDEKCNKIYLGNNEYNNFDYVFVDEAQDMSPAQLELVIKATKSRNTRVILMGDSDQAINMWCGSINDALDKAVKKITNNDWLDFNLTTNYRCDTKIIDMANEYLKEHNKSKRLAPHTNNPGMIQYNAKLNDIQNGDLVLARFTSTVFEVFGKLIQLGKKAVIRGENEFLKLFNNLAMENNNTIDDILLFVKESFVNEWESATKNDDYKESIHNEGVIRSYEIVKIIESLSKITLDKEQLIKLLKDCIVSENHSQKDAIEISTVHRAKGAEADNVYIACPSVLYSPLVDEKSQEWERISEENLQYVAYTRAKHKMAFIDEKEIYTRINVINKENSLFKEMSQIKEEIEKKDLEV